MIPGVEIRTLRRLDDSRGWFLKAIQQRHLEGRQFGEAYLSVGAEGETRANHYHKTDWHYCYVVSGCIEYHHRPTGVEIGQLFGPGLGIGIGPVHGDGQRPAPGRAHVGLS